MASKVSLNDKFALFEDLWAPRLAARYNGNEVRLAKVEGEFHWHHHPGTDELFLVIEGELDLEFRDRTEHMAAGDLIVVPKGTEHRPCAQGRGQAPDHGRRWHAEYGRRSNRIHAG